MTITGRTNHPQQTIAALRGVSHRYGNKLAVDHVDLEIRRGQVLALLGPNGAGKTTAISLLMGLQSPDEGTAELFGLPPSLLVARQRIGVMLQAAQLPELLQVDELIALTRSYYPKPRSSAEIIALAGLGDIADRRYGKLSGGQQRRVQFALALCGNPELIFLDEPTTGLDIEAREALWKTIRAEVAAGCSVLLTTHYLEEAEALADSVAVLANGRLVAQGSVDDIRARVSGRQLRARSAIPVETALGWPGVSRAERESQWLNIAASDAESVLRLWLAADPSLSDLEVRRAGLAEAFVEITRQSAVTASNIGETA